MSIQFGKFKAYDLYKKEIIPSVVALTSDDDIASVSKNEAEIEVVYLQAMGQRDRYVVLPEIPQQIVSETLYPGDILSNVSDNLWVIKFDLILGVYCTMVDMPDAYNKLETLLSFGCKKIGDIFSNPELLGDKSVEVFL